MGRTTARLLGSSILILLYPPKKCMPPPPRLTQVCGLSWSPDGNTLASGGNENFLCLWDASMSGRGAGGVGGGSGSGVQRPRETLRQHQAAVKALAWCPSQRHLLASGGGTADRTIKVCCANVHAFVGVLLLLFLMRACFVALLSCAYL